MTEHAGLIQVTTFRPVPGRRDELLALCAEIQERAAVADGCFGAQTCAVDEDPDAVAAISRWRDRHSLEAFRAAEGASAPDPARRCADRGAGDPPVHAGWLAVQQGGETAGRAQAVTRPERWPAGFGDVDGFSYAGAADPGRGRPSPPRSARAARAAFPARVPSGGPGSSSSARSAACGRTPR
jgi:quinol monooxygenase YgiN